MDITRVTLLNFGVNDRNEEFAELEFQPLIGESRETTVVTLRKGDTLTTNAPVVETRKQDSPPTESTGISELHDWVFGELGFCGCGDPEEVLEFVKSVLLAIRKRSYENREIEEGRTESLERWRRNSAVIEELIGMNVSPPMAWFFLYTLNDKDLLEHGGNCSGSWLTEKGEEVLDALNRYSAAAIIDCECDDEEDEVLDAKVIDG